MIRAAFIAALLAYGAVASAEDFSYSYFQAAYQDVDIDSGIGVDVDGDGYSVSGAVAVGDNWFVFADYATADFGGGIDLNEISGGGGYHQGLSARTDWFATLGFVNGEVDTPGPGSFDDNGLGASIGLRSMMNENLELYGSVGYVDFDDFSSGTSVSGGFWYTVSGNIVVGLGAAFDEDVTSLGIGIRMYFDR